MLKRFRVSNFRSLLNVEFLPVGLNLLIGRNNAGKTNLCSALRFVALSSAYSIEDAARRALGETWNVSNIHVKDQSIEFEVEAALPIGGIPMAFAYSLKIGAQRDPASLKQSFAVVEETLKATGGEFSQTSLLENRNGQVRLLHEKRFLSKAPEQYVETYCPQDVTMLSRLYDLDTNRHANLFKRYLQTWYYYNLNPNALRSPDVVSDRPVLQYDGGNLSKVLFTLHNEKPRLERKIIESVRELEPKLDLFTFVSPDPEHVYLFLEDQDGNRFSTQSISDGTLRFLAMAYLIWSAACCAEPNEPCPLLIVEEPENGLYVGHLKSLIERIDPSGKCGQFVFTSHSPYFIDLFDSNIEGVHVLRPGKPSSVLVRPDVGQVRKLLDQMPLGEMHYREMLG